MHFVIAKFEESIKIVEEALKELKKWNKDISSLLERQMVKLAIAKTISEALYLMTEPYELFSVLLTMLTRIKGFDLPFMTFFEPEKGFNILVADQGLKPLIERIVSEILLSEEDPFVKGIFNKKIGECTEFQTLVAVPIEVEEEFRGIIGILSQDDEIKSDDCVYLREISQNISTALRQRMLILKLKESNRKLKESFKSSIALIEKIIELKDQLRFLLSDYIVYRNLLKRL